jgi:DNA-binding transcriptional LysR family regulator
MDTTKLDLNLLLTLEALLNEKNVTKAATRLHLSQPAVSAQLNRLRDMFGDPLLIPRRRGMTPTAKAMDLILPLRESLDQLRRTLQVHNEFNPQKSKLTVSIACTDYIQSVVVMPLVLALREKAPDVRIAVHPYLPSNLEQQLSSGMIDIGIVSKDPHLSLLRSHHLFFETYVLIGRRHHPLLHENMTMHEFVKLDHVIVSPAGGGFTSPIDDVLSVYGLRRKVVLSAASFYFIPQIVARSDLVALVPRRLLQTYEGELSVVELEWLAEKFDVSLIWHEMSHAHSGHRWMRELIIEAA